MRQISCYLLVLFLAVFSSAHFAIASGSRIEADLTKELKKTLELVLSLKIKVEADSPTEAGIQGLARQYKDIRACRLLIESQFEDRLEKLGPRAVQRHRHMAGEYDRMIRDVLSLMQKVMAEEKPEDIEGLIELLTRAIREREEKRIFGNTPYRHIGYAAKAPVSEPVVTPAFQTDSVVYEPADLNVAGNKQVAGKIASLAQTLQWNPVSIYEWVKNNIATEWYYGSMKGPEGALAQYSGNDFDQASLLVSLLRASGYPARYVRGVIEFFPDMEKAMNLTGTRSAEELGEFFKKAGVPCEAVVADGRIVNYRIEHVWVEALLPWANYRGAAVDEAGKAWVALDTSIKGLDFTENTPADLPGGFSFDGLRDIYLDEMRDESPLDFLRSEINENLGGTDTLYEDLLLSRSIDPEIMNVLPPGLQCEIITVTHEYAEIPDELKHQIRFTATRDGETVVFDETLETSALSNAWPSLQYEPETVEDQETINTFYGLDNTPPYLIRLRPVLVSNEKRIAVGTSGFSPGETFSLQIELIAPGGTQRISNVHAAGDVCVIGVAAGSSVDPEPMDAEKENAVRLLKEVVSDYISQWNSAEDELAALFKTTVIRPIPTVVTAGCVTDVDWLMDVPVETQWKGVFIDADLRAVETTGGYEFAGEMDSQKLFVSLSGMQGSTLEGRALNDAFGVKSVSTAAILGAAAEAELDIASISGDNIDAVLPGLALPDYIKTDVRAAVENGYDVRIPVESITILDWTGYGYLKENPATGEAGWMLSGMIAGGMTAGGPGRWDDYFVERLTLPNTDPVQADPSAAAALKKLEISDFQDGTAGAQLEHPLQVIVLDVENQPVADAEVTFQVLAGGGHFQDNASSITVKSNISGIANVPFFLGEKTGDNPTLIYKEGYTYNQQVGENIISAEISQYSIPLRSPFTAYGYPGPPANLNATLDDNGTLLAWSGRVRARVSDQYENPLSNETVTFSIAPAVSTSSCEKETADQRDTLLFPRDQSDCIRNGAAAYGDCPAASTSVSSVTQKDGISAYIMGGGIPEAKNEITLTCGSLSESVVRHSDVFGNCSGEERPDNQFSTHTINSIDSNGSVIDAVEPGGTIKLQARIRYLREEEEIVQESIPCDGGTKTCDKIIGARKFFIDTDFISSDLTFDGSSGTHVGSGLYEFDYTVEPGVNEVTIRGSGEISTRRSIISCDSCRIEDRNVSLSAALQKTVYGVSIETAEDLDIATDDDGVTQCDVRIDYTITPAEYEAMDAGIYIYEDDAFLTLLPSETQGAGFATLAKGFKFNEGSSYHARVFLNKGSGSEIKSQKILLNPDFIKIKNITMEDLELHQSILPGDSVTFLAESEPAGRPLQWSVRTASPDVEVTIGEASGELHVDELSKAGWVVVRAADAVNSCVYREVFVYIGCQSCGADTGGACYSSASYDLSSIDIKIGLGRTTFGSSAGNLVIKADTLSPALLTPSGLTVSTFTAGIEERFNEQGQVRQVLTPEYLVDIPVNEDGYEIVFYKAGDIIGESDGLYDVGGAAFDRKWRLSSPDMESTFTVSETIGGKTKVFEYLYDADSRKWTLSKAGGLVVEERSEEIFGKDRIVTDTRKDKDGAVASKTRTTYHSYEWGEEITRRVKDPDGAALATETRYYTDEDEGSYGRIKETIHPDGSWTAYEYDEEGRLLMESTAWLDASPGSGAARVTQYSYEPVDNADSGSESYRNRPRTVTETVDGVVTSRTYHAYIVDGDGMETAITERAASQSAGYGDPENSRTVTITHPEGTGGPESGRVKSTRNPDGRMRIYTYEFGTYTASGANTPGTFTPGSGLHRRTTVLETSGDAPSGVPNKSTRRITITSDLGETLLQAVEVYTGSGFERISWTVKDYDDEGRIIAEYNSDGTSRQTDWSCCNKEAETDARGNETQYQEYDELNRLKRVTRHVNHNPVTITYEYDAAGRRKTETTAGGSLSVSTSSEYDTAGRLAYRIDTDLRRTDYEYSADGRTTTVIRPGGSTEITVRYADGRTKSVTGTGVVNKYYSYGVNEDGSQWTQVNTGAADSALWERTVTDMLGRTIRVENPGYTGIQVIEHSYDENGRRIRTSTPGQADTLYVYDDLGNRIRSGLDIDSNGMLEPASTDRITDTDTRIAEIGDRWWRQNTRRVYPKEGTDTAVTVSVNRQQLTGLGQGLVARTVTVDVHGNQTVSRTLLDAEAQKTTRIVDYPDSDIDAQKVTVGGLLVSGRSKTGVTMTYGYDDLRRRITETDPRTGITTTHYDERGQVDWVEDPSQRRTDYDYDPLTGRKTAETNPDGNTTRYAYNERGQIIRTWGDAAYPVEYGYDEYGRMQEMHTFRTELGWDDATWPASGTGDTTTWHYDPATGLLEEKEDALGNIVSYTYNNAGKLESRTWARTDSGSPVVTSYAYDPATGELTLIDYSDDTPDIEFAYDRLGRKKEVTDATGSRSFTYNDALQLKSETLAGLINQTITRSYSESGMKGRNSGFFLGSDYQVAYSYDSRGRLDHLDWNADGRTDTAEYGYLDNSDLVESLSIESGATTTYSYEPHRNLKTTVNNSYNSALISNYEYAYDALGRRITVKNTGQAFTEEEFNSYDYNKRNELTESSRYQGTDTTDVSRPVTPEYRAYGYDPIGNREEITKASDSGTYTTNELNQYVSQSVPADGSRSFSYDADGNLTSLVESESETVYTWNAENRLTTARPATPAQGDTKVSFVYDYQGRRAKKTVYTYTAAEWQVSEEKHFVYDGWNLIEEITHESGTETSRYFIWGLDLSQSLQGAGGIGGLIASVDGSLTYCFTYDANGNVGQLVNATDGTIAAAYEYDPYGSLIRAEGEYADQNPFRFSTKYQDTETGLYYYGYRYYMPELGRWVSRDPIEEEGGVNVHAFVENKPLNFSDFLGMDLYTSMRSVYGLRSYSFTKPLVSFQDKKEASVGNWVFVNWRIVEKKNWWTHYRRTEAKCKNDCTARIEYVEVLYEQWRPTQINTFPYPNHNPLEPYGEDDFADATINLVEAIIKAKNRGTKSKLSNIKKEEGQQYCDKLNRSL